MSPRPPLLKVALRQIYIPSLLSFRPDWVRFVKTSSLAVARRHSLGSLRKTAFSVWPCSAKNAFSSPSRPNNGRTSADHGFVPQQRESDACPAQLGSLRKTAVSVWPRSAKNALSSPLRSTRETRPVQRALRRSSIVCVSAFRLAL